MQVPSTRAPERCSAVDIKEESEPGRASGRTCGAHEMGVVGGKETALFDASAAGWGRRVVLFSAAACQVAAEEG